MTLISVVRSVRIDKSGHIQKLPIPTGYKIQGARIDDYENPRVILIDVLQEDDYSHMTLLRVKILHSEPNKRVAKKDRLTLIKNVESCNGIVYVYEVTEGRRSADDLLFEPIQTGWNILPLKGNVTVNLKCPLRFIKSKPHLVFRADRRGNESIVHVILIHAPSLEAKRQTESAQIMAQKGQVVELTGGLQTDYIMYVSPEVIPQQEARPDFEDT